MVLAELDEQHREQALALRRVGSASARRCRARCRGRGRPPADYDREALDAALLTALAADGDGGMTTSELLEALDEHCDATSARLRVLCDDGVVTDWRFEDGRFERRAWELVRRPTPR